MTYRHADPARFLSPFITTLFFLLLIAGQGLARPQWQTITLKNGLQVIVVENRSVPLVTVEIAVKNGSYTEPPEFNGLSHLYEHMFFNLNERSRTEGYYEKIVGLGLLRNAETKEEVVNYYGTAVRSSMRGLLELMRDAIRYPAFDKQELDQEIQIVLDEFSRHESNPFHFLNLAVDQKLWYKYFSRKNKIGDRKVIATCTPEKMRDIQRKFYVPNNAALIVAGDVSAPEVFKMAEEFYGDWPRSEDPFIKNPLVQHPPLTKDETVIVTKESQAATIFTSWHGPSTDVDAPGTYAADVFSFIVNQPDSKFRRALVESGITTFSGIGYLTQRNVGPIQITSQTTPDKLKQAMATINAEIVKFDAPDYFTDEQLESARTLIDVNEVFSREKPSEYAHSISFWWASSGLDYYGGYIENVRRVTRADIQKFVRRYIKGKFRVTGVMLPEAEKMRIGLTEKDLLPK
ncbi:MAG: M16 family metallopeptidase [Blastocatellia bacterium]